MANNYEEFFAKAARQPTSLPKGSATTASVAQGLQSVNSALIRSPQVMSSGKYDEFFNRAAGIASGAPKEQGGILGAIGSGALGALEKAGYALGAPARVVASAVQETKDVLEGKMPSLKDFVSQAAQKDFYLSKVFHADTGTDWLDTVLNLTVDIAGDPLTYIGVGAVRNAGRGGRVGLSETAATMPELFNAQQVNEIARLGQFAELDKAQQAALNIQHGLRFHFGDQRLLFNPETTAGRVSAQVGEKVGRGVSTVRANIGDILLPTRVREVITPRSYRILGDLGRRNATVSGANLMARVAAHSSATAERAQQALFESLARGEARNLLEEVSNSPYRATIYQVMDGTRNAVDSVEADLAARMKDFVDKVHSDANAFINEVNGRRGINASTINTIEDYGIKRSLTPEARSWVNSSKGKSSKSATAIAEATGLTKQEFISGPDITRMRRLVKDSEFLGETLTTGSVDEINSISEKVLGFKWFETDAPFLVSDYVTSASKSVGRIAFVDRLLDFSPEIVDKLLYKIVPTEGVQNLSKAINALIATRQGIANSIDILESKGLRIVDGTLARAEAQLASGVAKSKQLQASRRVLQRNVRNAEKALAEAEAKAAMAAGEARAAYETILQPLRTRIGYLKAAVESADSLERAAMDVLAPIHQRILPDVAVPANAAETYNSIVGALEGRVTALEGRVAAGETGLERQIASAKGQVTKFVNQNGDIVDRAIAAEFDMPVRGRPVVGNVRSASVLEGPVPSLQTIDYAAAKAELRRAEPLLAKQEKAFEDAISAETKKALKEPLKARTQAVAALDNNTVLKAEQRTWERTVRPALIDSIDELREQADVIHVRGSVPDEYTREWISRTDDILNQINDPKILNASQKAAWDKVFTSFQANEIALAKVETELAYNQGIKKILTPPVSGPFSIDDLPSSFYGNIEADIREGWAAIEGLGIQMPKELGDLLFGRIADLGTVKGFTEMFDIFKKFNQFFRTTAMLTPGFIVRNSYTAAFNNFSFGCTLIDTEEGIRFATMLHRRGAKAALESLPEAGRETTELAYKAVLASGLNQTEDIIQPVIQATRQSRLMKSRVVQTWAKGNQDVETAVRMTMALRGAKNGMTLDEITAAVSRYHFNYGDLSKLDEYAKVFIPFWTFASRNIPLQITNQIMRPSMYRAYESVQRAYPPDENLIMPEWLARRQPLGIGENAVLNPDLPQIDMADQIRQFSDPLRLLGQFYPQYRLIPELAGNRMYGTGIEFSDKLQPVRGPLDYPSALLGMLTGQTVDTASGPALTSKGAYVLPNVLPTLGTLQRLLPQLGGQARYQERQGSSIATALGVPYRSISPEEQQRTLKGREIQLQNLLNELKRRGYVG